MTDYPSSVFHIDGESITAYRVENNSSGNPRYVVHYLAIPYPDNPGGGITNFRAHQLAHQNFAARVLGGTRYRAKWFGGGIVFTSFDLEGDLTSAIRAGHAEQAQLVA